MFSQFSLFFLECQSLVLIWVSVSTTGPLTAALSSSGTTKSKFQFNKSGIYGHNLSQSLPIQPLHPIDTFFWDKYSILFTLLAYNNQYKQQIKITQPYRPFQKLQNHQTHIKQRTDTKHKQNLHTHQQQAFQQPIQPSILFTFPANNNQYKQNQTNYSTI